MTVFVLISQLLSFFAGFHAPIVKEQITNRVDQIEVCADGGCHH
jgi:hypothetical protein